VLSLGSVLEGIAAGSGAIVAIVVTQRYLENFKETWFRRLAILLMLTSGPRCCGGAAACSFDAVFVGGPRMSAGRGPILSRARIGL
jgi:hypothetical protein